MPDIRYICLSDTHFGAETSILTRLGESRGEIDPLNPAPVMVQLVECLKTLIRENENQDQKPALIINGDCLELALANTNDALMVFERFVELTMPPGKELFGGIHIVPGNHDHHLWESARETAYVEYMTNNVKPGDPLKIPYHATNIFTNPTTSYTLTRLVQRFPHLADMTISASYPNYGIIADDGQKCVIFHHGHFTEPIYKLMSALKTMLFPNSHMPQHIWDIEAENFAWIDFLWSTLGRSGDVGDDVGRVYERLQNPEQLKKLLSNLAESLARRYDLPGWGDGMEKKIMEWFLHKAADKVGDGLESQQSGQPLTKSVKEGLTAYMEAPLRNQFQTERGSRMPAHVTFVFGHTHRPFAEGLDSISGYPKWVHVYNTGGWVITKAKTQPTHGGAVILVDENLDTVSLRMHNEADNPADYKVAVEWAAHPGEIATPFQRRITGLVNPAAEPWKAFSAAVAPALANRKRYMKERINA